MSDRLLNKKKFLDKVTEKGGRTLSDYIDHSTKVEIVCFNKHTWLVKPSHVTSCGTWCPKCPKKNSIKSKQNFLQVVNMKGGTLVSEYVNNNTYVILRCNQGHEWEVTPHSVSGIMNSWCPVCSNNCPKQAAEKFYQKVKDKEGITLGIYNGAYNKVTVQCKNGHIYDIIPHNLMSLDTWCPKCSNNCPEKAKEKFIQTVKNKSGVVIGEYINSHTKIKVMCVKGHEWDAVPSSVNAGFWCRACAGTCPIEGYKRLLDIVTLNKGEILSSYINSQTKVTFRCEFGHIWETCPSNITNSNCWCTVCSESNGERHVRHILTKLNIQVLTTKTHPCLKKKRYDFVFIHNDKMFYLEYDGKQHFEKIEFFSKTDEHHNYKRYVDILKSQTVISNGDYLIRIDYTVKDEDIETHILNAINGNEKLYLSNPDMYKWITININSTLNPIPNPLKLEIIRPTHTSGFQEQSLFRQSTIPYMRLNVIK